MREGEGQGRGAYARQGKIVRLLWCLVLCVREGRGEEMGYVCQVQDN